MKKFLLLMASIFIAAKIFAFSNEDIKKFTFENGLVMYFLEDNSSATVRTELLIRTGISSQNEKNQGLFTLYARLKNLEIGSDTIRLVKTVAPTDSEKAFLELSKALSPLNPSDAKIRAETKKMNEELKEYSSSVGGFINSAIEAKMSPVSPWKSDSGISPEIFAARSVAATRTILLQIEKNFFTARNSILLVSGNISASAAEKLAQKYFGSLPNAQESDEENFLSKKIETLLKNQKSKSAKKFVLHDTDFSDEITQIVVEYTDFSRNECDILAATLDEDFSAFKESLISEKNLAIRGAEYANVASAQKKGSSRLIFQSLLEKTKMNPAEQSELFLKKINAQNLLSQFYLDFELSKIKSERTKKSDDSKEFMEELSLWLTTQNDESSFFSRESDLAKLSADSLAKKLASSEPYVFVIVNSRTYNKYAKNFKKAGYEDVTSKNGAWYKQEFYQNLLKEKLQQPSQEKIDAIGFDKEISKSASKFIEENRKAFSTFTLKNGIPVVAKRTKSAKTVSFTISIQGGDYMFAPEYIGLATVLIDAIAVNIRNQIDLLYMNGFIKGQYDVSAKTGSSSAYINVTCAAEEFVQIINATSGAFVYGDITPVLADGITYDERTQWRLKKGSSEFQLLSAAIKQIYSKSNYPMLFDDKNDKPSKMDFYKISEVYPLYLDSSRFSIALAGGIKKDSELKEILNNAFGILETHEETAAKPANIPEQDFSAKTKRIQLKHLFLTDVAAEDAGPRPQILIPTTKFLDPVLYVLPSPEISSTDSALFNALLYELSERIEKKAKKQNPEVSVKIYPPEKDLPFARISILNVERTNSVDKAYKDAVSELTEDLRKLVAQKDEEARDLQKAELVERMENLWILNNLSDVQSALGTVKLIQKGCELKNPKLYLDQYEAIDKALQDDYFVIAQAWLEKIPPIRIYSADSRK